MFPEAKGTMVYPDIPVVMISSSDGDKLIDYAKKNPGADITLNENNTVEQVLSLRSQALYISDTSGVHYTKSLEDVKYIPERNGIQVISFVSLFYLILKKYDSTDFDCSPLMSTRLHVSLALILPIINMMLIYIIVRSTGI